MQALLTVVPIFLVIILGGVARRRGFITQEFLGPANRLVYYLSIPAMIFSSIAGASFQEQFDAHVLLLTLLAATVVYLAAGVISRLGQMAPATAGVFIQSAGHGNLGYIGLPITLYYLGDIGLARAGIICGFLMILQNLLSVVALQLHDRENTAPGLRSLGGKLVGNPVIIGAMLGIAVSVWQLPVPVIVQRTLDILGGLAPPMALLLIGASLSPATIRHHLLPISGAVLLKLAALPALGLLFFWLAGLGQGEYLPALILLCSPTATVTYVMAREMRGNAELAVSTISASTLFSSVSFVLWLTLCAALAS